MNIKAILASLILGSSSIALASPAAPGVTVSTVGYGNTAVVRDHRFDNSYTPASIAQPAPSAIYYRDRNWNEQGWNGQPMPLVQRPVVLASGVRLAMNGRQEIWVGPQQGRFTTLKLDGIAGRSFIGSVMVQFANGQKQILSNFNQTLVGNQCLTIDLDGGRRAITRVIVYGTSAGRWGRAAGAFNVTAV